MKNINIPEGVEEIGWSAFESTALKNIEVPSTVNTISKYAFIYCNKLETVTFKSNNPSNYSPEMFWYRNENEYVKLTVYVPNNSLEIYRTIFSENNFISQFNISTKIYLGD